MRRYRRLLYGRLGDYATLITGPSGTGKELVARAVGLAQYIPFDGDSAKFAAVEGERFLPLNLSALSPTLIESELFGHRRGAFTGAAEHREGWLERCAPHGAVFLDEIGELAPMIQVKLLRVLQDRTFQRLGDAEPRTFRGKLISATNRDLPRQMQAGEFREDLYYRLCSDIITTPSLRTRLDDDAGELRRLIGPMIARMFGDGAEPVVDEVLEVIEASLGPAYPWPGNVRELEQCVRNVVIRREYAPRRNHAEAAHASAEQLVRHLHEGRLTVDELVGRYCRLVHARTGSYEATAQLLKIDRRTVKAKIDGVRDSAGNAP
ncbi:MAG: sigma-54 factor interaction domain-containing protein [Pirellulales bacterium]